MTKFALYYAVERGTGKLVCISLEPSGQIAILKDQAKSDMTDAKFANQYETIVLADYYGLKNQYKVPFQEAPKKTRKKISEE